MKPEETDRRFIALIRSSLRHLHSKMFIRVLVCPILSAKLLK